MPDKKRTRQVDWEDLRVLIELSRLGTLSATAREMGVTHATVGRRLAALETDLAQPLFVRDGGKYALTEAGKRILDLAKPMSESADAVMRAVSSLDERLTGPVRITATEAIASFLVMPALGEIRRKYPDLDLLLNITQLNLNLARSDADIAVRLARPESGSGLIGVKASDLDYNLYASKSYIEGRRPMTWDYLGYPDDMKDWPEAKALDGAMLGGGRVVLKLNHLGNRMVAARLGMGVGLIPDQMAASWPDLARVSNGGPVLKREVYLLVHEDMREVPRIKACLELLSQTIQGLELKRETFT
jgi:DNA-binding transcriptional LysR family regulator